VSIQDPAVDLAQRQLDAAVDAHTQARAAYDNVQERIGGLAEDAEPDTVAGLAAELDTTGATLEDTHSEVERCRGNLEAAERRAKLTVSERRHATARGSVKRELTYRPDVRTSFFQDAYRAQFKFDTAARERLDAHQREMADEYRDRGIFLHDGDVEQRDVGTGAFTGLVTPVYLEDQFVAFRRAGFPLYDWLRKLSLPGTGMTVNIGRLTTGTATAAQSAENAAVQETDSDDTLLTVNVRTYAGQQDLSRQSIERGVGVDAVIYEDLTRDYYTKLGDAVYNADGTSGTHLGIRSTGSIVAVTYTDASPTVPELWPKLQDAIQQVNAGIFAPANVIVMHPRRWGWMNAAVDGSSRPFVTPNTAVAANPFAVGGAAGYGTPVGSISGLPVITDGNIKTNLGGGTEDNILVLGTSELFFWQEGDGSPRRFQFEQSNAPQSVRLAVWGYSAFTAGRYPLASANITGTGLAAPTF
jgi:HK97 family phage major capsid protein